MEYIVTLLSPNNLERYLCSSAFIMGNDKYATRIAYSFSNEEMKEITSFAHKHNKKVYININRVFTQSEVSHLKEYLIELISMNVDYILFSDFAIVTLAKELDILDKLVYYSETQLVNSSDSKTLYELGIENQIVSKDATLIDIENIAQNKDVNLGVNVFGYYHLFYSKRKLLSAYCKQYNLDENNLINKYDLKLREFQREELHPVIEDKNGLNIFSGEILLAIDYMDKFISSGYSNFIFDGIFFAEDEFLDIISMFINKSDFVSVSKKYPNKKFGTAFLNRDLSIIEKVGECNE